jgi:hypothetical protein
LKKSRLCQEISKILDKSRKSQFVLTISICLDDLDKYLDEDKSHPKNLDFKNLDRDKIKVDLNLMDNLNRFQKLVSTQWTFLISISIGLERRDHQAYSEHIKYNKSTPTTNTSTCKNKNRKNP